MPSSTKLLCFKKKGNTISWKGKRAKKSIIRPFVIKHNLHYNFKDKMPQ